jgi:hypothetical protein
MRMPPYLLQLRVIDQGQTKIRLWLPLFLLWLLLLPLLLVALALTLLADLLSVLAWKKPGFTRFLLGILGTINAIRGTEVHVEDRTRKSQSVAFTLR